MAGHRFVRRPSPGGVLAAVAIALAPAACRAGTAAPDQVLEVVGHDYAFEAADTVPAGPTVIRFRNAGKVRHELVLMKLKHGVSLRQVLDESARSGRLSPLREGGSAVLFAPPQGTGSGRLAVDLEPGRTYLLWCNFQDHDGAPEHSALGMARTLSVAAIPTGPPPRSVPVVTVTAADYAFRVADSLPAGLVDLKIENVGHQRHELSFGQLAPGVTAAAFFAALREGRSVDSLYDDDGAILTIDPNDGNPTAIRVELLAGRSYVLVCGFQDTPSSPPHVELGMFKGLVAR